MSGLLPKRARLLEFSLAVAVIGVVSLFLISALLDIEEEAERLVVEATIRNINSGYRSALAELIIQGREGERSALLRGSPVRWLQTPPAAYEEVEHLNGARLASRQWVWERATGVLHYQPRARSRLRIDEGTHLQWKYLAVDAPSWNSVLQPVHAYRWAGE